MTRIAMRCIRSKQQIALLSSGRHSRRRPDALDIEHHSRHFGVVRKPDEFVHERNAWAAGRRKRTCSVPARTDHSSDRRKLVLTLHDHIVALAGLRIDTPFLTQAFE